LRVPVLVEVGPEHALQVWVLLGHSHAWEPSACQPRSRLPRLADGVGRLADGDPRHQVDVDYAVAGAFRALHDHGPVVVEDVDELGVGDAHPLTPGEVQDEGDEGAPPERRPYVVDGHQSPLQACAAGETQYLKRYRVSGGAVTRSSASRPTPRPSASWRRPP